MRYEWYVDVFFLTNFLMDSAGLLACAAICNRRVRLAGILLASAASAGISIAMLLCMRRYLLYRLLIHIVINPIMTAAVFRPKQWTELVREMLCVYLIFFLAGGLQESIHLQTGSASQIRILISGGLCIGWFTVWQIRQRVYRFVCAVDLWMDGQKITLEAYYDSGNLLRDPGDDGAVSIVKADTIPESWKERQTEKREIPFRTLNDKTACLQVITLERMDIYRRGTVRQIDRPKIGLQAGEMMQGVNVQMILHSSLLG